jgi:hypothetical protein
MTSTEETIVAMRRVMRPLLETAMEGLLTKARGVLEMAEQHHVRGLAEVAKERAKGLAEVAEERAHGLADIDARRAELELEVLTMQKHKEAQEGCVELNIGGYRFHTSVQALRRVPHTFFDAYFSGRYAQDVCDDGSIFVDRDGEHFGHILEYMRDGVVSVAEPGARPSVSLLRALKREFGFYCMELCAEPEPEQPEMVYAIGGYKLYEDNDDSDQDSDNEERTVTHSSMERYDPSGEQWTAVASMGTVRYSLGACVIAGEIYVTGGADDSDDALSSVEKFSPSSGTWRAVAPLPEARSQHASVAVGSAMYVLGGRIGEGTTASVLTFDSIQGAWSRVAPMPESSFSLAACAIYSDIYVFGGFGNDNRAQASVRKYDTEADEWITLAPMPITCVYLSASVLDGLVYIVGAGAVDREVLRFDPASGAWTTLTATSISRLFGASFVLSGCLYAAGGTANGESVERYDPATDTWTAVANMLDDRFAHCAVTIGSAGPAEEQDLFDSLIAKATTNEVKIV